MLTTKQARKRSGRQADESLDEKVEQEFVSPIIELMLLLKSSQNDEPNRELNKISIKDATGRRIYF